MSLAVTQSTYAAACGGLTLRLVSMRFAGLPYTRRGKSRLYALADVLPGIKKKYLSAVPALLESAVDDGQTYVGGDEVLGSCARLEEWLRQNVPGAPSLSIGIQLGPLIGAQKGPLWRDGSWPEAA